MKHYVVRAVILGALPLIMAGEAVAQDAFQTIASNYSNMAMNGLVQNQLAITQASIGRSAMKGVNQRRSAPVASDQFASALAFRSSPSVRSRNFAAFLERTRRADPAGAANLAALLRTDPIAQMGPALRALGLRTDNVADAYTVWWMNAWQAAHGDLSDASRAKTQAVRAQAAGALASTPELRGASDAAKQEFAEALLIQAALIGASAETYAKDPAMMRKLGQAVRQGARASGLDLDAMTLTEQGFVPARKTGSAEPARREAEGALAAGSAREDGPSYTLLAAVGGAGLGAAFLLGKAARRG